MLRKLYITFPTFKETSYVQALLDSLEAADLPEDLQLHVVAANANPGDETSALLHKKATEQSIFPVTELPGNASDFWAASTQRLLHYIKDNARDDDLVILCNADVTFAPDTLANLLQHHKHSNQILGALVASPTGTIQSSGVQIKSKLLSLNKTPLLHTQIDEMTSNDPIPVNILPCKCILFHHKVSSECAFPDPSRVPHYTADYIWTHTLGALSYDLSIIPSAVVVDQRIPDKSSKRAFVNRVKCLASRKSVINLLDRFRYVNATNPLYLRPLAYAANLAKISYMVLTGTTRPGTYW